MNWFYEITLHFYYVINTIWSYRMAQILLYVW